MKKLLLILLLISTPVVAQPTTTKPDIITMGLTTCTANKPIIGTGLGLVPACATPTYPSSVTAGGLLWGSSTNVIASTAALTGILIGNGTSAPTTIAGTTCTNQFLRAFTSSGGTCATIANDDVANLTIIGSSSTSMTIGTKINFTTTTTNPELTLISTEISGYTALNLNANSGAEVFQALAGAGAITFKSTTNVPVHFGSNQKTVFSIDGNMHLRTTFESSSTPTLTSCGTSPSITGSDISGEVTMGTGTPTGCIITFANAYVSAPYCHVTWQATPLLSQSFTVSNTAITLTQTATDSNKVTYSCFARSGG